MIITRVLNRENRTETMSALMPVVDSLLVGSQCAFSKLLWCVLCLYYHLFPILILRSVQNVFQSLLCPKFLSFNSGWRLLLYDMIHLHHFSYCFSQQVFVSILDINECVVGSHNCHADSNCSNTKGSFYCTCLTGYSGDGVGCVGMCEVFSLVIILWKHLSNVFGVWVIDTDNSRII